MESYVRSSSEQRENFRDTIFEEINDMFTCLEPGCREVFTDEEIENVGMRIIEP